MVGLVASLIGLCLAQIPEPNGGQTPPPPLPAPESMECGPLSLLFILISVVALLLIFGLRGRRRDAQREHVLEEHEHVDSP